MRVSEPGQFSLCLRPAGVLTVSTKGIDQLEIFALLNSHTQVNHIERPKKKNKRQVKESTPKQFEWHTNKSCSMTYYETKHRPHSKHRFVYLTSFLVSEDSNWVSVDGSLSASREELLESLPASGSIIRLISRKTGYDRNYSYSAKTIHRFLCLYTLWSPIHTEGPIRLYSFSFFLSIRFKAVEFIKILSHQAGQRVFIKEVPLHTSSSYG